MRYMKLYNLVQYLRIVGFYHDTFDLEDLGVDGVLRHYGIIEQFSTKELEELSKSLTELAEANEFREIELMIAQNIGEIGVV